MPGGLRPPFAGQARSHRYCTRFKLCVVPVGEGLHREWVAKRPQYPEVRPVPRPDPHAQPPSPHPAG
ncbi:hypothetical protein CVV67_25155 [Arthrobacter stackebrandtii]|nr:hypothetical protein CVV67_25155 [Arthrobacter stackebrandtii]